MKLPSLASLILLTGCTAYQYVPSPCYVPLHADKKEVNINAYKNAFQIGYSPTNKFSVFATYHFKNLNQPLRFGYKESSGDVSRTNNSYEINFGGGYFKNKNKIAYEI